MYHRLVIEENTVYEIDEECLFDREKKKEKENNCIKSWSHPWQGAKVKGS